MLCQKRGFEGFHDRFLKDDRYRESQLEHDRTEEVCIQVDEIAQKYFSFHTTQGEHSRHKKNWWISLNICGGAEPRRGRSDFNDALSRLNRLRQESGEEQLRAHALLEVPGMATVIEFFLHLVAMEWILVELIIQMQVRI